MANFDQRAVIEAPKYSRFDFPFESIGTLQMGVGTPVLHKPVIPGDEWTLSVDQIMRLAPLSSPVFDDVSLHFRAFFVPNRILDPRWKEFITGGIGLYGSSDNEIAPVSFTVRSLVSAKDEIENRFSQQAGVNYAYSAQIGGLSDWLNFHFAYYDPVTGRPSYYDNSGNDQSYVFEYDNSTEDAFDLLPFLGYHKIYDDWYRNERYQAERLPQIITYLNEDSADDRLYDRDLTNVASSVVNPFQLWRVNYGKDRYTTALPEPTVGGDVMYGPFGPGEDAQVYYESGADSNRLFLSTIPTGQNGSGDRFYGARINEDTGVVGGGSYFVDLKARVAQAAQDTIRNLKTAFKMYSFFMKDTYNGNRYVEFMDSHFDVRVPDSTLDRAIYLGDHKVRISFGEVFQTSGAAPDSGEGVLGDYAGRGAAYSDDGFLFKEKFLEHGHLYVVASIVPRAKYYQGIDRKFFKKDRFSYFFPEFQNIGDDILYSEELYYNGAGGFSTFGYSPRWADLKENLDEVHGDFLSSMDEYHFGRVFDDVPQVGSLFSQVPTINRPFSVTDEFSENYLINMRWRASAARPIMMFETF